MDAGTCTVVPKSRHPHPSLHFASSMLFQQESSSRTLGKSRRFSTSANNDPVSSDIDNDTVNLLQETSEAGKLFYMDVLIVGAGAAGIGVAHALLRGGLAPSKMLLIEKGPEVGTSFRQWHKTTRFISPSWPGYPFGIQDLNAIVPDTSVNAATGKQHPTGDDYADYLLRMMRGSNLMVKFNDAVTSMERIPTGSCYLVKTRQGAVLIANQVVWAGGEWNSPRVLRGRTFEEDAVVHYKYADVEALLSSRRSPEDPIVLVGGGEAGADLGVVLAQRGAKVLIVEAESSTTNERDASPLDPSRNLSPVTQERIQVVSDFLEVQTNTSCTGVERRGDTVIVTLERRGKTFTVETGANVVLCTGFDISQNHVLKNHFAWRDGSPVVSPENDESTISRSLYLAGPMLVHQLQCSPDEKGESSEDSEDNGSSSSSSSEDKSIIFCFVYKYRTRFAVVAKSIINRYVEEQRALLANSDNDGNSEFIATEEELETILVKCQNMEQYYRSKGMMLTDLSCATLACGMTTDDAPKYDYEACGDCPPSCNTC